MELFKNLIRKNRACLTTHTVFSKMKKQLITNFQERNKYVF